jgi:hypothetical protein
MLEFELELASSQGRTPGYLQVDDQKTHLLDPLMYAKFIIQDLGQLKLVFGGKTENDTVIDSDGNIVADTEFRILNIRCNQIKLEPWILTDFVYYPDYFSGYLQQFPDSPITITSPYQYNFPGTIEFNWVSNFWDWYFEEKNKREVIGFLEKDPDRVWKFRGSLDPCEDLVEKIKELIQL